MDIARRAREGGGILYRIEVEGSLSAPSAARFETERVAPAGSNTRLDLRVADQSELLGRLRRIHDLNLRLVSVRRLTPEGS